MKDKKMILVLQTGYFGDLILTSKFIHELKKYFPDKKIIFICDTPYVELVRNLSDGVFDVIPYNRKKDGRPINFLKFIFKFPYRNQFDYAFILHSNKRIRVFLSRLLGAKHAYDLIAMRKERDYISLCEREPKHKKIAYVNADLIYFVTKKFADDSDVKLSIPQEVQERIDVKIQKTGFKNLVGINPQAASDWKCWNIKEFVKFVKILIKNGFTPVITGVSKDGPDYVNALNSELFEYKDKILNLIDKTSFIELGAVYKRCLAGVSVDTGTAHVSYAVSTPTVMLFFRKDMSELWAPVDELKNTFIDKSEISAEEVFGKMQSLLERH